MGRGRGRARTPPSSSRRRAGEAAWDRESPKGRGWGRGWAIAPDPIPFIDLFDEDDEDVQGMDWTMAWKEEATEVLHPGLAWAMADHKALELAKHSSAEQERLKISSESKGRRRTCGRRRTASP